jgi:uncharacterized surface protein with fasciclin (FAS1) repeats
MPATTLARCLLSREPRSLYLQGLALCGLLRDIEDAPGGVTLLAPQNAALERSGVDRLFADEAETETLFNLFEYSVLSGHHEAVLQRRRLATWHGEHLVVEHGIVVGAWGAARVLGSVAAGNTLIHFTDRVLLPAPPPRLAVKTALGSTLRA